MKKAQLLSFVSFFLLLTLLSYGNENGTVMSEDQVDASFLHNTFSTPEEPSSFIYAETNGDKDPKSLTSGSMVQSGFTPLASDNQVVVSQISCLVYLSPSNANFPYASVNSSFLVMPIHSNCVDWYAASNVYWITILEPSSGFDSGNKQVKYSVSRNTTGFSRTGHIRVNNSTFTITQAGCNSTPIAVTNTSFPASGGSGTISVNSIAPDCEWSATVSTNATSWINILSGSSGMGSRTIIYTVSPNTSTSQRVGTITVNNTPIVITQEGTAPTTCNYTVNPPAFNLPSHASTNNTFTVTTNSQSCQWTAVAMQNWTTITAGSNGTGNGVVRFSVTENRGTDPRTGSIDLLGTSVSVPITQVGRPPTPTCSLTLDPTSFNADYRGGTGSFQVQTNLETCSWTATTEDSWITITSGHRGTGNGRVSFSVLQNFSTSSRSGKITVNGQDFNITQSGFSGDSSNLGRALDNTVLIWQTGGNLPFYEDTSEFYYGNSSAKSGPIGDNQSSWLQTTVIGPGELSFYWKVSSETGFDKFRFSINGIRYSEISGLVDWRQFSTTIPEGVHTLRWTYSKDPSGNSGNDAGWVDKVEYVQSGITPRIVPLHRFYNPLTGAHFYTANDNERQEVIRRFPNFIYEGVAFYVYSSQETNTLPVYRFLNIRTGVHFYTINEYEKDTVLRMLPQFVYEGIAFYAFPERQDYARPVYRFYNRKTNTHFYTIYEEEKDHVLNNYPEWSYEFIAYYAIN